MSIDYAANCRLPYPGAGHPVPLCPTLVNALKTQTALRLAAPASPLEPSNPNHLPRTHCTPTLQHPQHPSPIPPPIPPTSTITTTTTVVQHSTSCIALPRADDASPRVSRTRRNAAGGPAPDPTPPLRRNIASARASTRLPTLEDYLQPPWSRTSPVHRRRSPGTPAAADSGPWVSLDSSSISAYAGLCRPRSCLPGAEGSRRLYAVFTAVSPRRYAGPRVAGAETLTRCLPLPLNSSVVNVYRPFWAVPTVVF